MSNLYRLHMMCHHPFSHIHIFHCKMIVLQDPHTLHDDFAHNDLLVHSKMLMKWVHQLDWVLQLL